MSWSSTYILPVVLLAAMACQRPETPFGKVEPRLVVISQFTSDQTLEVEVSESNSVFSSNQTPRYVYDASIRLFRDSQFLQLLQLDQIRQPPVYVSRQLRPEPNVVYRIEVEAPGFRPVTAHSSIPSRIQIGRIQVEGLEQLPGAKSGESIFSYRASISFVDPVEELNYYHLNFIQQISVLVEQGESAPRQVLRQEKAEFSLVNPTSFVAVRGGGLLFSDEDFNGKMFSEFIPLSFRLREGEILGKLVVELRSVSEDYYLFQKTLTQQASGPGLPIQDEIPVYNNIRNGQGIFAGYNFSIDSIPVIR